MQPYINFLKVCTSKQHRGLILDNLPLPFISCHFSSTRYCQPAHTSKQQKQSTCASQHENVYLDVLEKYKVQLKLEWEELEELESKDYDSSSSDIVQAHLEIALCKRKCDQEAAFSRSDHTKENKSTLNIPDCQNIDPISHVMA